MIRRTVEISREPAHLATRDEQLLILRRDREPQRLPARPDNLAGTVPMEDLGVLVVDERDTTYSHAALVKMAEHGAALVVCGRDHQPCGLYLPLSTNTQLLDRLDAQLSASRPTLKRLWQAIVIAKIRAQADNLGHDEAARTRLLALSRRVRSGDPDNLEATAAQRYWPSVFADIPRLTHPFRRRPGQRDAAPPNNLLDYGYAAMRAAVARAIISAGLLPALGIKHRRRDNPFCLADDLVEPLRPMIDWKVRSLCQKGQLGLDQPTKAELLLTLSAPVRIGDAVGPASVAIIRYIASFARVLAGEAEELDLPAPWYGRPQDGPLTETDDDPELSTLIGTPETRAEEERWHDARLRKQNASPMPGRADADRPTPGPEPQQRSQPPPSPAPKARSRARPEEKE